jgi:hypothetical protein
LSFYLARGLDQRLLVLLGPGLGGLEGVFECADHAGHFIPMHRKYPAKGLEVKNSVRGQLDKTFIPTSRQKTLSFNSRFCRELA